MQVFAPPQISTLEIALSQMTLCLSRFPVTKDIIITQHPRNKESFFHVVLFTFFYPQHGNLEEKYLSNPVIWPSNQDI